MATSALTKLNAVMILWKTFQAQLRWYNSFYMKYTPDEEGNFNSQTGYGYISFEKSVDAVTAFKEGRVTLDELDKRELPTLGNTVVTTAILEAGRRSLDERRGIKVLEKGGGSWKTMNSRLVL